MSDLNVMLHWCQGGDLNPRPPAYETSALNQLSYPDLWFLLKLKIRIIAKHHN